MLWDNDAVLSSFEIKSLSHFDFDVNNRDVTDDVIGPDRTTPDLNPVIFALSYRTSVVETPDSVPVLDPEAIRVWTGNGIGKVFRLTERRLEEKDSSFMVRLRSCERDRNLLSVQI